MVQNLSTLTVKIHRYNQSLIVQKLSIVTEKVLRNNQP